MMTDRHHRRAAAAALLALLGLAATVPAAEPPLPASASQPAAPPISGATPATPQAAAPDAKPPNAKTTPLHFEPTEKTRADFEVSFPSDI